MWKVVAGLVVAFLVLGLLGLVLRAVRWLIGLAIIVAVIAALLAAAQGKKSN
ncbi:MAG: hypothetical protein AB1673_17200 [Actinomycetota bacterium]|jgi:hypothetical protein